MGNDIHRRVDPARAELLVFLSHGNADDLYQINLLRQKFQLLDYTESRNQQHAVRSGIRRNCGYLAP